MSSLHPIEPLIDKTISHLISRFDEKFASPENTCPVDEWLLFFAWDIIGELTFSKPMGLLASGRDDSGLLKTADKAIGYMATIGQMPFLDRWLGENPVMAIGPPSFEHAAGMCIQQLIERQHGSDKNHDAQRDMLDDFLGVKAANPEVMNDNGVVSALMINIVAGADTTAILLRAIFYYVLKNPNVKDRLQKELDEANLTIPVSFAEAEKLPYLDAVIKESMRIHPGIGLMLERVVPDGGLKLTDGKILPQGTIVGMNAWVVHQDQDIFGPDAATFNPNRWLSSPAESAEQYQQRLEEMKHADLSFGAGNRVCIGKNVTILETYKLIATLFLTYDVSEVYSS
jgi:cytochrome P450